MNPWWIANAAWGSVGILAGVLGRLRRPKTAPERLLESPLRKRLVEEIRSLIGANESHLVQATGAVRGSVRHHLELLVEAGVLKRVRHGRENHYFPSTVEEGDADLVARARSGRAWEILRLVLTQPGVRQDELAQRLRMTRKILRRHLDTLLEARLIEEWKHGRHRFYMPKRSVDASFWDLLGVQPSHMGGPPPSIPDEAGSSPAGPPSSLGK